MLTGVIMPLTTVHPSRSEACVAANRYPTPWSSWPVSGSPIGYFPSPIPKEAAAFYQENGFLVVENAFSPDEVDALNDETLRICRNEDGKVASIEPAGEMSDEDALRRVLCIHFPHKMSELMFSAVQHHAFVDALTKIIAPDVKCMQSMLFVKAAGKPGQAWHQDEDYIPTRDRSLTGGWIALDDATIENGCLWVIPGSHKPGILWEQQWHGDRRFDCALESIDFPYTVDDEIPVEVKSGSIVFFNGYLLHRSMPNNAARGYRRSLVNHYMSASSFLPWRKPEKGSMAMADYRDIVMIAGKDPYAYRGIEELATPLVRPSGEGGCVSWGNPNKYLDELEPSGIGAATSESPAGRTSVSR
jgi:ectoine hydroxylase-related dioxygenase (phytanoyl-CoA dioxygenase family)